MRCSMGAEGRSCVRERLVGSRGVLMYMAGAVPAALQGQAHTGWLLNDDQPPRCVHPLLLYVQSSVQMRRHGMSEQRAARWLMGSSQQAGAPQPLSL